MPVAGLRLSLAAELMGGNSINLGNWTDWLLVSVGKNRWNDIYVIIQMVCIDIFSECSEMKDEQKFWSLLNKSFLQMFFYVKLKWISPWAHSLFFPFLIHILILTHTWSIWLGSPLPQQTGQGGIGWLNKSIGLIGLGNKKLSGTTLFFWQLT